MDKVRVGLIGAGGGISNVRGNAFLANPKAEITLASARNENKWPAIKEKYKVEVVKDFRELVTSDKIDAVSVAVPNLAHYEIVKVALENKKHVIVEYPMVQTLKEYDELVELARRNNVILHHGLNCVLESRHILLKKYLSKIGKPLTAYDCFYAGRRKWYNIPEIAGDLFLAAHIHFIAYQMDLFGEVESVYASRVTLPLEKGVMDIAPTILNFKNGVVGIVDFGVGAPKSPPPLTNKVTGEKGCLEVRRDERGEKLYVKINGESPITEDIPPNTSLKEETDIFIQEILEGLTPPVTLEEGREITRICLLASQSAKEKRLIKA